MEIIKSIRTWKPLRKSKALQHKSNSNSSDSDNYSSSVTDLNSQDSTPTATIQRNQDVFKPPFPPRVDRSSATQLPRCTGPLTKPPPHFLQPKSREPFLYQDPRTLTREQQQVQYCPSCKEPFDHGKKRRLIDSCGHERCYTCMFSKELCSLCTEQDSSNFTDGLPPRSTDFSPFRRAYRPAGNQHGSPASRSVQSEVISPLRSLRSRPQSPAGASQPNGRVFATPPAPRRRYFQSPKPNRPSWMQRHLRRPQTVNVDDTTLSDDNSSGRTSTRGSVRNDVQRPPGHLTPSHFARSSSLGGPRVSSTNPSSVGQESGFQSCASLVSIPQQHMSQQHQHKPAVVVARGSPLSHRLMIASDIERADSSLSGSMASLASGFNSGILMPTLVNGMMRHSLNGSKQSELGSRISAVRRSARQPATHEQLIDPREQFAQYGQPHWVLKPLFFEVPQRDPNPIFMGRQWLYGEIVEHLISDLPTNKGVIITGAPGTGKTAIILKLVEMSCFGRGEPIYHEAHGGPSQLLPTSPNRNWQSPFTSLANQVVSYHFCQAENAPTCSVPEFVHSMASQLSQSPIMKPYYQLLVSNHKIRSRLTMQECLADPDTSFLRGIIEPLRSLHGQESIGSVQCVMIIDGLCDSELHRPDHGDTIGTFVAKHLKQFPPWLKVVCTVRSSMMQVTKGLPFHQISLDKSDVDERIKKDIVDYLNTRISTSPSILPNITPLIPGSKLVEPVSPQQRFMQHMIDTARGSFLFVKLVLELIERGHLVVKSSSFKVLPVSLAEVFQLECNLKFSSEQAFAKVADILAVCLASLAPMTVTDIYQTVCALKVEPDLPWQEFVARFNSLSGFLVRRGDDTVMFYHPLFRDWLIRRRPDTLDSGKFLCDPRSGHLAIALKLSRTDQLGPQKTLDLCHHMLKAHVYRNNASARDLQAVWLAQCGPEDLASQALGCPRNIYCPNPNVSRLLCLAGASPHFVGGLLQNAPLLSIYANEGFDEMVRLLLEFGADVNCRNADGVTPLMFACKRGHSEVARTLTQAGAQMFDTDNGDRCALVYAAESGHLDIVEYLVSCDWHAKRTDLGLREAAQQAVVTAASKGNIQVLEFLLDMHEVTIDMSDTLSGETALCSAAGAGQKGACDVLLRRGASLSATNLKESPPLHMSTRQGHWGVADTLLKEGAAPNQLDGGHRTPLMIASLEGHLGLVELLLSRGAHLEAEDRDGLTSLSWACLKGQAQTAAFLIQQGSLVEHSDKSGRSCLDLAAYKGNPEVVSLLLDAGANMEHVDLNGMRPLDRAISCRNPAAVQCFLKKGAKLGPATWAMANGKPDIMLLLLNKLLEDGNTLFKKDKISEAAHRYQYALRRLPAIGNAAAKSSTSTKSTFDRLNVHLLLNLSRCKRKCGNLEEALELANKVLNLQPTSFEAYYAKAKANRSAGRLQAALQDLTEALKVAPQHREVHKVILRIKEEMDSQSSSTSTSTGSPTSHLTADSGKKDKKELTEGDSTSGVDSTGSSGCCTKDFEHEQLSNSMVI